MNHLFSLKFFLIKFNRVSLIMKKKFPTYFSSPRKWLFRNMNDISFSFSFNFLWITLLIAFKKIYINKSEIHFSSTEGRILFEVSQVFNYLLFYLCLKDENFYQIHAIFFLMIILLLLFNVYLFFGQILKWVKIVKCRNTLKHCKEKKIYCNGSLLNFIQNHLKY